MIVSIHIFYEYTCSHIVFKFFKQGVLLMSFFSKSYDYDIAVIGLGPAGMSVAIMGSEMGLKVCAIEKHKVGGECMNVGCIPSKALLKIAETRHAVHKNGVMGLGDGREAVILDPFTKIDNHLKYISEKKTLGMFKKTHLMLGVGSAEFVDKNTLKVGEKIVTAKKIFICVGTKPYIPKIEGIESINYLTNENIFSLKKVPASLTIIGGGAIGCEMSQAFSRLGTKVTVLHIDEHLLPFGPKEAGKIIEDVFKNENITVLNKRAAKSVRKISSGDNSGKIELTTDQGEVLLSDELLIASGRTSAFHSLKLNSVKVEFNDKKIFVNNYLQTNVKNIYAIGDCNGNYLLSHAAMHQGMLAIMNAFNFLPFNLFKFNFKNYVVPWTVFTTPQVSHVGLTEKQLKAKNKKYEIIRVNYGDYGAAIAENLEIGYLEALVSPCGKIYGMRIVGDGSGEMINEWALAIQKKVRMHDILFLQHSFPTMSFLSKRIAETWVMNKMEMPFVRKILPFIFRYIS